MCAGRRQEHPSGLLELAHEDSGHERRHRLPHPGQLQGRSVFPEGSIDFDWALLMRGIEHEWHGEQDLCCDALTK